MTQDNPPLDRPAAPLAALLSTLVVVAITLCAPADGHSQSLSPEQLEAFKKRVKTASEQYKSGEYDKALEQFRAARELLDLPEISYRIGRSLEKVGHCSKAESTYRGLLEREKTKEKHRAKAEKRLDVLDEECVSRGKLVIRCKPENSSTTVAVAGQSKSCPATFDLKTGEHTIEVSSPGYPHQTDTTRVSEAETTRGVFNLSTPSPEATGETEADGPDWMPIAKWGSLGVGAGFLTVGLIDDIASSNRFENRIEQAESEADPDTYGQAITSYEGSRSRITALYVTGAVFTVAGATLYLIDSTNPADQSKPVSVSIGASPTSVFSRIRW